jgi:hypothetical protein
MIVTGDEYAGDTNYDDGDKEDVENCDYDYPVAE